MDVKTHNADPLDCLHRHGSDELDRRLRAFVEADEPTDTEASDSAFSLERFAMNGLAAAMQKQMLEDKFVLGRMAILGQSTVFYAAPNVGKTLLTLHLIIDGIQSGELNASDLFYINADDNHAGLLFKLKLAEKHGFAMLAPGYRDFKAEHLAAYLNAMIKSDTARGKILILDTVKKFVDLMRKDRASRFGQSVRQFVSHGGTVIMLAHVNKHRGEDQRVIYSGTSDLVDDADCAYTIDKLTEEHGIRTVRFENFKSRGAVESEAVYRYDCADGTSYYERLDSVAEVGREEREAARAKQQAAETLARNREAVEAITESLRDGITQKTELIKDACSRSGISKKKIANALKEHTGTSVTKNQFWYLTVEEKNAHVYRLNAGAS